MTQYVGPMNGRPILYPNQVPYDTDFLREAEYRMVDIAFISQTVLGFGNSNAAVFCGLTVTQDASPDLAVTIGQGAMYQVQELEPIVYGNPAVPTGIGALTTPTVFKQAINISAITEFGLGTFTAPSVVGQSQYYLIQVLFSTAQTNSVNRPYYNPANPSAPIFNNLPDTEWDIPIFSIVAGVPGVSPVIPSPTGGAIGLYTVLIAHGATTIVNADIAAYSGTTFVTETLTQKISQTTADARYLQIANLAAPNSQVLSGSGNYTTPTGALYLRVRGCGAGGGGAGSGQPAGSNGSPGSAATTFAGGAISITANVGGAGLASGVGGAGGTCSGATYNWTGGAGDGGDGTGAALQIILNAGGGGSTTEFGGGGVCSGNAAGGNAIALSGAGGSGAGIDSTAAASQSGAGGGAGGNFECIIPTPVSTYAFVVGTGGAGGAGGTNGAAGGNGAAGTIIVEAFFQ